MPFYDVHSFPLVEVVLSSKDLIAFRMPAVKIAKTLDNVRFFQWAGFGVTAGPCNHGAAGCAMGAGDVPPLREGCRNKKPQAGWLGVLR
jgi:hypothetical protein